MKVLLYGFGEIACVALDYLRKVGDEVVGVTTTHPNPGEKVTGRVLFEEAHELKIPFTVRNLEAPQFLFGDFDVILSVFYRHMLSRTTLIQAPRGAFNVHGSLLPAYRGRCPINWAILEGAEATGLTLHRMTERADAGDIVHQYAICLTEKTTAPELYAAMCKRLPYLLRKSWGKIRAGKVAAHKQDESRAFYRGARTPEMGQIDWSRPTVEIDRLVRAVTDPYPGAFTYEGGRKLMIWEGRYPATNLVKGNKTFATGDGWYEATKWEYA